MSAEKRDYLLPLAEAMRLLGIKSRSTYYEGMKLGKLPPLHELYPGSRARRVSGLEIEQHIANAKNRTGARRS
jgi:predicted DNA-binding transcriptional regulator AlpA